MRLTTLSLLPLINATSFSIQDRYDPNDILSAGCYLQINNVCGCTKQITLEDTTDCSFLPTSHDLHGSACGGKWKLYTTQAEYRVHFYKGNKCGTACNLGVLTGGASC